MFNFFYKRRGVITVFLLIIMLPLFTSAVLLVDGTRYQSAKTMVQEAGDLAAYSTIADYNMDLKDNFGLFAINSPDAKAAFMKYFKETLGYSASEAESYTQKVQNLITNSLFQGNEYAGKNFYNMYNFEVDESATKVDPMYPLSDPGVLQNQIVEYTKYRGVETLLERFEIISNFSGLSEELNNNSEKGAAIQDLSAQDTTCSQIAQNLDALESKVTAYNSLLDDLKTAAENYETAYETEICELAIKGSNIATKKNRRSQYYSEIVDLCKSINETLTGEYGIVALCGCIQGDVNIAITNYTRIRERYASHSDIVADVDKELEILNKIISTKENDRKYSVVLTKQVLSPANFFNNEFLPKLETAESKIKNTYEDYNDKYEDKRRELDNDETLTEAEKQKELDLIRYHVHKVTGEEWFYTVEDFTQDGTIGSEMRNGADLLVGEFDVYRYANSHLKEFKIPVFENYYQTKADSYDTSKIPEEIKKQEKTYASSKVEEANNKKKPAEKERVKLEDGVYSQLPSRVKGTKLEDETNIADMSSTSASNAISSANTASSILSGFLESGRNDVLTYAYILDTFKTRVTEKKITSKDKPSAINERNLVDWRYSNDVGEKNFRDQEKNALTTKFATNEVEYIFGGRSSEGKNELIVYSWIYGTRLANNLIAVYMSPTAKAECEMLAAMSSAASMGTVPPAVFKWIYIAAWAAGETALELAYLIDDGYRISLIKNKDNLFIEHFWDVATAIGNRDVLMQYKSTSGNWGDKINVCYEDYLIILMCFVDKETRLLRVADLVQLNMQANGHNDFKMSEANTYIRAETVVNMKYLFQPIQQFTNSYKGNGLVLKNTIYQGY